MEICWWCGCGVTEWFGNEPVFQYDGYAFCCNRCKEQYRQANEKKSSSNDESASIISSLQSQLEDAYQTYGTCTNCGNSIKGDYYEAGSYRFCCKACYLKYQRDFPDDLMQEEKRAENEKRLQEIKEKEWQREREKQALEKQKYDEKYKHYEAIADDECEKCNGRLSKNPIPYLTWGTWETVTQYKYYEVSEGTIFKKKHLSIAGDKDAKYISSEVRFFSRSFYSLETVIKQSIDDAVSDTEFRKLVKKVIIKKIYEETQQKGGLPDFCDLITYKRYNRAFKRLGGDMRVTPEVFSAPSLYDYYYPTELPYRIFINPKNDFEFFLGGLRDERTTLQFNKTYDQFAATYTNGSDDLTGYQSFYINNMNVSWNSSQITFKFDEITSMAYRASGSLALNLYFFSEKFNGNNSSKGIFAGSCDLPIERKLLYPGDGWKNKEFTAKVTGVIPSAGDYYPTVVITEHSNGKWYFTGTGDENVTTFALKHFGLPNKTTAAATITNTVAAATNSKPVVSKYRQMMDKK